jgi:hypothetical protein
VRDLCVKNAPHADVERRVAERLGEEADPCTRGRHVAPLVEGQRSVDVRFQRIRALHGALDPSAE